MNIINTAKLPKDKPLQFEGQIPELKGYSGRYTSLSKLEETLKEINEAPNRPKGRGIILEACELQLGSVSSLF